ncbi:MAG TPA: hypothetical protein VF760_04165 [Xanthobacteraceae bacterium]
MTRLQRILGWVVGWTLAMLVGEVTGLLLAAGVWMKSTLAADLALSVPVIVAFCFAPAAATSLVLKLQANAVLERTGDVERPGPSS